MSPDEDSEWVGGGLEMPVLCMVSAHVCLLPLIHSGNPGDLRSLTPERDACVGRRLRQKPDSIDVNGPIGLRYPQT